MMWEAQWCQRLTLICCCTSMPDISRNMSATLLLLGASASALRLVAPSIRDTCNRRHIVQTASLAALQRAMPLSPAGARPEGVNKPEVRTHR